MKFKWNEVNELATPIITFALHEQNKPLKDGNKKFSLWIGACGCASSFKFGPTLAVFIAKDIEDAKKQTEDFLDEKFFSYFI